MMHQFIDTILILMKCRMYETVIQNEYITLHENNQKYLMSSINIYFIQGIHTHLLKLITLVGD